MFKQPVIITCAINGHRTTRAIAPVPFTPVEQAKSAQEAVRNGAAIIHLHVRGNNGEECFEPERYCETISQIKQIVPTPIIEITPRGTDRLMPKPVKFERGNLVKISAAMWGNKPELKPEMCALNLSTRNIDEQTVLLNPPSEVKDQIERIYSLGLIPRCDLYDIGDIRTALGLLEKGILREPLHFLLILGSYSGIGATSQDLEYMVKQLPETSHWTALGSGSRYNSFIAEQATLLGGHIRTGFEDETYVSKGQKAKSNAELVANLRGLCEKVGRPIATPDLARQILGLQQSPQQELVSVI
ncbi:3-keto-5-aminohexanoate cleavage protein [Nostoc sp. DedQUE09]|uniref:3-keto-5-aminohexanoate cleavage protein n=1 Tax=Nostoc sp. DedQUE09 TaxID=3075394 RepID=UPI002AD4A7E1|nr:3-keto-5-aminohexanoate cleavage protein [Nostoc sp. DedQUE09]MDZ7950604.1 3-keto-5-aminohexanoate cleavage protein [Nostoc sp. DedQUE09]